jgi:hypothetical protein
VKSEELRVKRGRNDGLGVKGKRKNCFKELEET